MAEAYFRWKEATRTNVTLMLVGFALTACEKSDTPHHGSLPDQPAEIVANNSRVETDATIRVFARDAIDDSLPLPLCIETLGGISTEIIPRGTKLPAERRETFSTAADNQTSIQVHPLVGARKMANDNIGLGKFTIVEIPAAPRGTPKIEVTFVVDVEGRFSLRAKDLATERSLPTPVEDPLSRPLARPAIEDLLRSSQADETIRDTGETQER